MYRAILILLLVALLSPAAGARGRTSTSHARISASHATRAPKVKAPPKPKAAPRSSRCASCARDAKGRIARGAAPKRAFQEMHPCPSTGKTTGACKGYVIDHVVPLKRGGADAPGNMQWQTTAAAKAKDKVE
jgi:5-methylcytosine-specific restriction endonuclease McrA